ncbi:hypothetical protein F5X98DRAFT_377689 [Xylaria grammica]|nr:hypothetical protein F5X98DRAFT_377689 [Xylaria grammica]
MAESAKDRLLLFGGQALRFNGESFRALSTQIRDMNEQSWVAETIKSLPACWEALIEEFPQYGVTGSGPQLLAELSTWFEIGSMRIDQQESAPALPNIILSPLVVVTHLIEYLKFLDTNSSSLGSSNARSWTGALGFCTGFLSASAVALSKDSAEVRRYGATAIRLAMLIGGIVDAQGCHDATGPAKALATAWSATGSEDQLKDILRRYPESYVSVEYDQNRATITTASSKVKQLQQELRDVGIVVSEIGLSGRFHHTGYLNHMESLIQYCTAHSDLCLPDASTTIYPTWCSIQSGIAQNSDVSMPASGPLHAYALKTILAHRCRWHQTFSTVVASVPNQSNLQIVLFGPERCIPTSMHKLDVLVMSDAVARRAVQRPEFVKGTDITDNRVPTARATDDVAIIGMSIKVAGADDVDDFWDLLCHGSSQHQEVPGDRLSFDNVWREKGNSATTRKWFGNFVSDHDAFDHKFFKKSAREMASTDPQQRLMLQTAYQAVEQSGYFGSSDSQDKNIGCFIGVCSADYENNAACYDPNAFTAIGNLKSFIAGKISHYFGWLGPSLCIDTACSSSLVAVHQACRAVLSGECSAALAGGANIMTNSLWYQNLAAASFLSPTGQCKPFDANADGYCRGEGFAAVLVKKMSRAIADGDQILGTISASVVYQNQNCTPVFVPNSPSLSDLFRDVIKRSEMEPRQITVVEAHGTGTQVGDPAEYQSVKSVLGPATGRPTALALGSVKGLVGHTECVSGAVSLIKTALMVSHKMIPPQVSFNTLNPAIAASPEDGIEIVTRLKPWAADGDLHAALINNYGASGSNASLVVTTAPNVHMPQNRPETGNLAYPIRFFGADERALRAYSQRLSRYLATSRSWSSTTSDAKSARSIANIAFNLSRQTNPNLNTSLAFSSNDVESLASKLELFAKGEPASDADITLLSTSQKPARPVILCFGGQVSTFVGLDHGVYRSSKIMRVHLHACDDICKSLPGVGSIFPAIHQLTPINDPVKLQTCLFAMQYACAQSWIGCGITPAAVVGHSFGELVALCVSGVLSLHDALELVSRRATLVRDLWGEDRGAMMAIEGEAEIVDRLLASSGTTASIACFNGPRSFTLAGTSSEIDAVAETLTMPSFSSLRFKRLSVTNAFHSALVEPLIPGLVDIGRKLTFNKPRIALELATKVRRVEDIGMDANYVARHMREPVYFSHAIERLAQQYPSGCIFLEAGSNSTITKMASRALGSQSNSHFQAVNISGDGDTSRDNLTNATINLWKQGLPVTFWPHHRMQTYEYIPLFLPPYQFEKSRHWLSMKAPPRTPLVEDAAPATTGTPPTGLFTFVEDSKRDKNSPRFRINTETGKYKELVSGHVIAGTAPICPATLIVDIVVEALTSARPDLSPSQTSWLPQIHQVSNLAPICLDDAMTVILEFDATDLYHTWDWRITSCAAGNTASGRTTLHVTGQLIFTNMDDTKLQAEFKRYERLTGYHQHCAEILDASDADDVIHGARNIYRAFSSVVDYPPPYQGVQRLVGKGNLSAGRVVQKAASDTWLDTHLSDSFSQVAGIWVNCMTDCDPSDMYIAVGFEKWIRSPVIGGESDGKPQTWDVMAHHERASSKAFLSDIFVFDAASGRLQDVILGVNYHKVSKNSMQKTLARLTTPGRPAGHDTSSAIHHGGAEFHPVTPGPDVLPVKEKSSITPVGESGAATNEHADPSSDVAAKIRLILADISGLSPAEISYDTELAEIGIDSLMGMELGREMEGVFKASLMSDALACVITFRELVSHVAQVLGVSDGLGGHGQTSEESDSITYTEDTSSAALSPSSAPTVPDTDLQDIKPLADSTSSSSNHDELRLAPSIVFEAFEETKRLTDDFITDYRCADYMDTVLPKQTQLCVALAVEACEQLGLSLRSAKAGESVVRIPHEAQHKSLVDWMYDLLEHEARLIDITHATGVITRTAIAAPTKSSNQILAELLKTCPDHEWAHRLTHFAGSRLADVLRGNQDGIKLIFGTDEGRQLVTGLYGDSLLNKLANAQMRDTLTRLVEKLPKPFVGPLRIMELGAGTGGTTKDMVPMLARLGIPVEYTFTDLSGSFVAAARKKFGAQYPFMKFRVHDIEKPPAAELPPQHIVIASNAIHATRNLRQSVGNIRKALRPDGFLLMLEMTQPLYWVDMIFGLFEGWWLFEDGRRHAIAHQTRWKDDLQAVGYGRVDWTDGWRPEIEIQRIIVAQASAQPGFALQPREMKFQSPPKMLERTTDSQKRQLDEYVRQYTKQFNMPTSSSRSSLPDPFASGPEPVRVAVTGGTGSLGAHLVAHLAALPQVETVYCLNRRSTTGEPYERQQAAISSRGIEMTPEGKRKLVVLTIDSSKAQLGLEAATYEKISNTITHIIHNAWPMTGKRPVAGLETQFAAMQNLIDLARDAALHRTHPTSPATGQAQSPDGRITFQFISSIAVMGHHSLIEGNSRFAPESRASAEQLLPNGYAQAKWVCERMLDETLHKFPGHFRACVVRPGQIAGSSLSGYWNENEHLSFLVKSSQTLKLLPALEGDMCWTPVDKVAAAVAELLLRADAPDGPMAAVYHIDNPVRQPWRETLSVLADELRVPAENIAPFDEWVRRVRRFPGSAEDNPAVRLVDFLDDNFLRMSCGGLLLETSNSCAHSPTMRAVGPVHEDTLRLYIQQWKATGFLHE